MALNIQKFVDHSSLTNLKGFFLRKIMLTTIIIRHRQCVRVLVSFVFEQQSNVMRALNIPGGNKVVFAAVTSFPMFLIIIEKMKI